MLVVCTLQSAILPRVTTATAPASFQVYYLRSYFEVKQVV